MSGQFKSKSRFKEVRRVPLALREGGTLLFQFPYLNQLGQSAYRFIALRLLKDLEFRFPEIKARTVGGAVARCIPGLSDIDLLLVLPDSWSTQQSLHLQELKRWYQKARSRNPLLGECFVIERSRELEGVSLFPEKWESLSTQGITTFEFELDPRRRLHLALFHYRWAGDAFRLRASRSAKKVWALAIRRQLSKVIALGENRSRPDISVGSLAELYVRAFLGLERLAESVLQDYRSVPVKYSNTSGSRRYVEETLLTEAWVHASFLKDAPCLYYSGAPFVLGWRNLKRAALEATFQRLLTEKNPFSIPLVLLGPSAVNALLAGWGQFYQDENLDWIVDNRNGQKNEWADLEYQRSLPLLRWGRFLRDDKERC